MKLKKADKNWNEDTARALTLYKNPLSLLGIWPMDAYSFRSTARWTFSVMVEISTTVSMSLEVYRHCSGPEDTLEAFLMNATSAVSLTKLLLYRVNWHHKFTLIEAIVDDWSSLANYHHHAMMRKYSDQARLIFLVLLTLGVAGGSLFVIMALPITDRIMMTFMSWRGVKVERNDTVAGRKLFLPAYCVFDRSAGWTYGLVILLQAAQIAVNCISQCCNDGFFFGVTMHLCGQFNALKTDFAGLEVDAGTRRRVGLLIERHRHLARMAGRLETAFSLVILAQLFMSVLLLCVEGFQLIISLKTDDAFTTMKHVVFIAILLVQLFLFAFAGDRLESETQGLAYAIYDCPWYNFDVRMAKDLPLVMLRAEDPHRVTAGKFLPMNLISFKEILKTSASYLSVLRVMLDA